MGDAKIEMGLLQSIASVLFGIETMLCALQLWLADTPSAHNSSYNVCNGELPYKCNTPFHASAATDLRAGAVSAQAAGRMLLIDMMCAVACDIGLHSISI